MKKIIISILTVFMLVLCCIPFCAFAAENIDMNKHGSISITVNSPDKKEPIKGLKLSFYRVADIVSENGQLKYVLADSYEESHISLEVNSNGELKEGAARALDNYAKAKGIKGMNASTNDNGVAFVENCKAGLYLVSAGDMPNDLPYGDLVPFLISLPVLSADGKTWEYSVSANPKVPLTPETTTNPDGTTTPDDTTNPDGTTNPNGTTTTKPGNPDKPPQLPNTGTSNWIVPILGGAGPLVFALGYLDLNNRKKHNEN